MPKTILLMNDNIPKRPQFCSLLIPFCSSLGVPRASPWPFRCCAYASGIFYTFAQLNTFNLHNYIIISKWRSYCSNQFFRMDFGTKKTFLHTFHMNYHISNFTSEIWKRESLETINFGYITILVILALKRPENRISRFVICHYRQKMI